ncbi:hypothetical protein C8Q79DRAFT_1012821 [Trametes meyenii]|nr:hypothetical protein C8Q79DRAFT_1012821 [Trametes meyenii]
MAENRATILADVPPDVVLPILELLSADRNTLRACALVNRSLLSCARAILYRDIILEHAVFTNVQILGRTLTKDPSLRGLTKSLEIRCSLDMPEAGRPITPDLFPFGFLTNLRTLVLRYVDLQKVDDLFAIISALPKLQRLVCEALLQDIQTFRGVPRGTVTSAEQQQTPHPARIHSPESNSLNLKEIVITNGSWDHGELAISLLLCKHGHAADVLQSLDVSFGDSAMAIVWAPVARAASACLRSLSISMANDARTLRHGQREGAEYLAMLPKEYETYHAYIFDNIVHCGALQFLCLKYYTDSHVWDAGPVLNVFLDTLCDVLERKATPFPALEHLELWMVHRIARGHVGVTEQHRARMAAALLNRQKYPRFARLTLRVRVEVWVYHIEHWSARQYSERVRIEVVEEWKRAFSAFGEAPGVVLDVSVLPSPFRGYRGGTLGRLIL